MINKQLIEEFTAQIAQLLPKAQATGEDAKKLINAAASKAFERLDIVTREDFEAQKLSLARAQERITQLEETLLKLEQQLDKP